MVLKLLIKNDFDQAVAEYTEAIRLDPKYVNAGSRGKAVSGKGDFDKAIADCSDTIQLDPNFGSPYGTRATPLVSGGREYDKAMADYNEAIRLDPKFAGQYVCRGLVFD